MIIELIGASGAGKSTLMRAVQQGAPATVRVVSAWDLVMDRPGRRRISDARAINLVADATAVGPVVGSLGEHRELLAFAWDRLRRGAPSRLTHANYARNVIRKIGMYEIARRRGAGQTVLFDEGPVLMAYQLFVYSRAPWSRDDLEVFASSVPRPDRLVHVDVPTSELVRRAMSRPDRRRELAGRGPEELAECLQRAREMFDGLASTEALRDRVIRVDDARGAQEDDRLIEHILGCSERDADGRSRRGAAEQLGG